MEKSLPFQYQEIVADSGYESEENHVFIGENGQIVYVKPLDYEIKKHRNA